MAFGNVNQNFDEEGIRKDEREKVLDDMPIDILRDKFEELRPIKEEHEFDDYKDMRNPNGHPDKLRQSKGW